MILEMHLHLFTKIQCPPWAKVVPQEKHILKVLAVFTLHHLLAVQNVALFQP